MAGHSIQVGTRLICREPKYPSHNIEVVEFLNVPNDYVLLKNVTLNAAFGKRYSSLCRDIDLGIYEKCPTDEEEAHGS